ncbi:AAA family ATPase [Sorangium sp. So ce834]|uniref:AAA family ATPase n=1 Tax=Sorangium sp. So ce834 TaxID=3133321 RepID=UPI003F5D800C
MVKPWEISSKELQEWAGRYDAPAVLPRLVRRLLLATSPLDGIAMRADSGTRYEGWDGIVMSRGGTAFCPAGLSVWELSVEGKVRTKLDKDYEKRSRKPPEGVRPALTTYVAVTARTFKKGKADWANEKRAEGTWKDVRVLDADDLATWIEQAPAVARWFASREGLPAYEGKDLEAFLEAWRQRTSPPLPHALVLAGDRRLMLSDQLLAALSEPAGRPLLIRGRTREEALLFTAATLERAPGAEALLSRALVVETEEAWRWAIRVQAAEPLIVLPAFDKLDPGEAAAARVRVLLAGGPDAHERPGSTLTLEEQPWPALIGALRAAGWSEPDAARLVREAGGDLAMLQRRCGYIDVELPSWAKSSPRAEIMALLLAGAWVPTVEGDREVLRRLGGDPAVAEQLCTDLQAQGVMTRDVEHIARGSYRWTSPNGAWDLLARGLTDGHLNNFDEMVMGVLGAPDPAYELPKEERFMAEVKGKALPYSDALRDGLAGSVLMLSLQDRLFAEKRVGYRGSDRAERLVRALLRADKGWIAWASVSKLLPTLAEAAPKGFLDAVEASLDVGEKGVAHLLREENSLFGGAPHAGLLWALEMLGWHPEPGVRRRVVLVISRLDAMDPGGRLANRPLQSLDTLLRAALPASSTTVEERIALVREVLQKNPPTGRKLALGMLRNLRTGTLLHPGARPRCHQQWLPKDEPAEIDRADMDAQIRAVLQDLEEDAGTDPQRWVGFLEAALGGPEDVEEHVVGALARQQPHISDAEGRLRDALRRPLAYLEPEGTTHVRYRRLKDLYDSFDPPDLVHRHAWLFSPFPSLPGIMMEDLDESERRIRAERDKVITELWEQSGDRWAALARLTRAVATFEGGAQILGSALARTSFVKDIDARLLGDIEDDALAPLGDTADEALAPLVTGYGAIRAKDRGLKWTETFLKRLVESGRTEDAALIAAYAEDGRSVGYGGFWKMLETLGEPLLTAYWRAGPRIFGDLSLTDLQYAVEHLVAAGREDAAVENAGTRRRNTTGELALYVLEKYRARANARSNPRIAHHIEQLFERIDHDPPEGKDPLNDLAPLELFYLPILSQRSRPARYVSLSLAERPDSFVGLIAMLYRREGEEPPAEEDEARVQIAQTAYTLLEAWQGYPGEGLPDAQRDARLEAWAAEVLRKTQEDGRGPVGSFEVAKVLARAPRGSDGLWPCVAARNLIETGLYPELGDHLGTAERNRRGVTGRALGEGGVQERDTAEQHREAALRIEASYPRTAAMLDNLARRYDSEADRHDARARRFQIEHGEQPESEQDETPPTPPDAGAAQPRAFVSRIITAGVGPARRFDVPLKPRLNLLIGDNSLGKTFVLEVLWWALTGAWTDPKQQARPPARPRNGRGAQSASILAQAGGRTLQGSYDPAKERWKKKGTRALAPGLTVYARADGSFSVWDPIRNAKPADKTEQGLAKGYHFSPQELWYGLQARDKITPLCRGLLEDAVSWRSERRGAFERLQQVLDKFSPPEAPIRFGLPKRFSLRDARTYPTLDLGYEANVFAVHASAAVKRILGLAYALVWAVSEIQQAAPVAGAAPLNRVTMLIDEVEAHLHPRWQRAILPALLSVIDELGIKADVQLIVTTHAPLVLASVETLFDRDQDTLLEFEQEAGVKGNVVRVVEEPLERLGDANTWLMQRFGLKQPRSREAEKAIEQAAKAMEAPKLSKKEGRAIHEELRKVLGELDPFWVRWRFIAEKRGWVS